MSGMHAENNKERVHMQVLVPHPPNLVLEQYTGKHNTNRYDSTAQYTLHPLICLVRLARNKHDGGISMALHKATGAFS